MYDTVNIPQRCLKPHSHWTDGKTEAFDDCRCRKAAYGIRASGGKAQAFCSDPIKGPDLLQDPGAPLTALPGLTSACRLGRWGGGEALRELHFPEASVLISVRRPRATDYISQEAWRSRAGNGGRPGGHPGRAGGCRRGTP